MLLLLFVCVCVEQNLGETTKKEDQETPGDPYNINRTERRKNDSTKPSHVVCLVGFSCVQFQFLTLSLNFSFAKTKKKNKIRFKSDC